MNDFTSEKSPPQYAVVFFATVPVPYLVGYTHTSAT